MAGSKVSFTWRLESTVYFTCMFCLLQVVQSEVARDHHDNTNISGDVFNEYYTNNNSLYCLIQNMKRIGMSDR